MCPAGLRVGSRSNSGLPLLMVVTPRRVVKNDVRHINLLPCAAEKSRAFALKTAGFSILRRRNWHHFRPGERRARACINRNPLGLQFSVFRFRRAGLWPVVPKMAGRKRPGHSECHRLKSASRHNRNVNRRHDPIVHRRSVAGSVHITWRCRLLTWRAGNDSDRQRQA